MGRDDLGRQCVMFNPKYAFIAILAIAVSSGTSIRADAQDTEFNTLLFQTTFKIEGPADPRGVTLGTVFLMSRPIPDTVKFRTVLITARHVLEGIRGDTAILNLRRRTASGWERVRYPTKIRDAGQPMWVRRIGVLKALRPISRWQCRPGMRRL